MIFILVWKFHKVFRCVFNFIYPDQYSLAIRPMIHVFHWFRKQLCHYFFKHYLFAIFFFWNLFICWRIYNYLPFLLTFFSMFHLAIFSLLPYSSIIFSTLVTHPRFMASISFYVTFSISRLSNWYFYTSSLSYLPVFCFIIFFWWFMNVISSFTPPNSSRRFILWSFSEDTAALSAYPHKLILSFVEFSGYFLSY